MHGRWKLGGGKWNEELGRYARTSKHKEVDRETSKLLNIIWETGWSI